MRDVVSDYGPITAVVTGGITGDKRLERSGAQPPPWQSSNMTGSCSALVANRLTLHAGAHDALTNWSTPVSTPQA